MGKPFTLHALWPFLWIWAMAYRPDRGWAVSRAELPREQAAKDRSELNSLLQARIDALEMKLASYRVEAIEGMEGKIATEPTQTLIRRIPLRMRSWQNYIFMEGH
jgi:hypothetical protein